MRRPAGAGRYGGGVSRPPPAAPRFSRGRGGGGGGGAPERARRDVAAVGVRGPAGPGAGLPVRAGPRAAPRGSAAALGLAAGDAAPRPLAGGAHGGGLAGGHCPPRAQLGARRRRVGEGARGERPWRRGRERAWAGMCIPVSPCAGTEGAGAGVLRPGVHGHVPGMCLRRPGETHLSR